jgi:hypothetical protein
LAAVATAVGLVLLAGACGSSGNRAAPPTTGAGAGAGGGGGAGAGSTSTSVAGVQTSGARTVLSPVGINVRAQPDKAAAVLGTAGQGVVLSVLGHTGGSHGWFQVKGATVTGWITDDPTLSAPGEFRSYVSGPFNALYPATWTSTDLSAATAVFRSTTGPDNIVSIATTSVTKLPPARPGYGRSSTQPVVVCGVTSELIVYQYEGATTTAPPGTAPATPYLAQTRLKLDAHHALGFFATLSGVGPQLEVFRQFLASVTFPFPQCTG